MQAYGNLVQDLSLVPKVLPEAFFGISPLPLLLPHKFMFGVTFRTRAAEWAIPLPTAIRQLEKGSRVAGDCSEVELAGDSC